MELTFFVTSLAGLFAIVNPVGAAPVFLALMPDSTREEREQTARLGVLVAGGVLMTFLLLGESILAFFGISLAAFRAAGGILILLMSIHMLQGRISPVKHTQREVDEAVEDTESSVAVFPLAIPLISGPGAISTVVLLRSQAGSLANVAMVGVAVVTILVVTFVCLRLAGPLNRLLGTLGVRIITRIMGLLLAALAVQFIADGLTELFPGLVGIAP